ncbi:MAG: hypothetical protein WCV70_01965 [Patescibacteria group bacterium]|jgi:hypothetical protein
MKIRTPLKKDDSVLRAGKSVSGVIAPLKAQDTGLVHKGWSVESDNPEGKINLVNLDYSFCPVQKDQPFISSSTMFRLADEVQAYGSLGLAAILLKEQAEGKEIFPVESRDEHYFIMPRTILLNGDRRRGVVYFYWNCRLWALNIHWLDDVFDGDDRFIRLRE